QEDGGGLADRLHAQIHGGLRLPHRDLVVLACGNLAGFVLFHRTGLRPLSVDGLVRVAQVLVDQGGAELACFDRPGHGFDLRHECRSLFDPSSRITLPGVAGGVSEWLKELAWKASGGADSVVCSYLTLCGQWAGSYR